MTECPNPDCKERVAGHHTTLFGKDGMSGLVSCVSKKVSRGTVIAIALVLLGSAGSATLYGLDAAKKDRKDVAENTKEIGNMKANLEWIKITVEENHDNLRDIKKHIKDTHISPNQLQELIKNAVKEGNKP